MSKYLVFKKIENRTIVFNKHKIPLGDIYYYEPWKQCVFEPTGYRVFSDECLEDIVKQIKAINAEGAPK